MFFSVCRFDEKVIAQVIVRLLNLRGSRFLALDRTNWKPGRTDINVLVLAIITPRFKVPIMWTLLKHRGNSSTSQRINLLERYIEVFGVSSIKALLADREFVGHEWIGFLVTNDVPFTIRLHEYMYIEIKEG